MNATKKQSLVGIAKGQSSVVPVPMPLGIWRKSTTDGTYSYEKNSTYTTSLFGAHSISAAATWLMNTTLKALLGEDIIVRITASEDTSCAFVLPQTVTGTDSATTALGGNNNDITYTSKNANTIKRHKIKYVDPVATNGVIAIAADGGTDVIDIVTVDDDPVGYTLAITQAVTEAALAVNLIGKDLTIVLPADEEDAPIDVTAAELVEAINLLGEDKISAVVIGDNDDAVIETQSKTWFGAAFDFLVSPVDIGNGFDSKLLTVYLGVDPTDGSYLTSGALLLELADTEAFDDYVTYANASGNNGSGALTVMTTPITLTGAYYSDEVYSHVFYAETPEDWYIPAGWDIRNKEAGSKTIEIIGLA